jgi:hypothetical protein
MTHDSAPPADTPHELLTAVRDLTRRVRVAQRGTWFPLLVLAVVTLAAIPIYRLGPDTPFVGLCRSGPDWRVCSGRPVLLFVYWPVALVLAYAAIAGFYLRQSRRRGVGTRIRPFVVVGVVLAVALAGASLWLAYHPLVPLPTAPMDGPINVSPAMRAVTALDSPTAAIGLALLVLAWVERHPALLAFSIAYLVIVLWQGIQVIHTSSPWFFIPYLLVPAAVLLLGAAGFALFRPTTEPRSS